MKPTTAPCLDEEVNSDRASVKMTKNVTELLPVTCCKLTWINLAVGRQDQELSVYCVLLTFSQSLGI